MGVHPRVGVVADVIPFVPLKGWIDDGRLACKSRIAREREIWRRFGVPVYFYESAAVIPERRRLEKVRRRGFRWAALRISAIFSAHPAAGASVVGARGFLIAFNVNLETVDAAVAQAIARKIRESSGGFRYVKAMGRCLASRGCAQISMNLTNFEEIPLQIVYTNRFARKRRDWAPEFYRASWWDSCRDARLKYRRNFSDARRISTNREFWRRESLQWS